MQQWAMFDLDGTLIDSSPSILACYAAVLKEAGLKAIVPLNDSLIGPPLRQTLMQMTGLEAGEGIEGLVRRFQEIYDTSGYKQTKAYPGVEAMLQDLHSRSVKLAIATNKRRAPTVKILEHLGWARYFDLVSTLDTPATPHADKAAMLTALLAEAGAEAAQTPYLGDTRGDGTAATANEMPFFAAEWGYGVWLRETLPAGWSIVSAPAQFIAYIGA